ncbi:MAG TPA: GNAT family N-acetyltransferase [Vicinamibacterales bacterium]|nr:GNAT family N-acetyltransferase [Vicinamibacterales bacterium]
MYARAPEDSEIDHLARLWFDGWQDAHAAIVPTELTRFRTLDAFRARLRVGLPDVRVVGPAGSPIAFYMLKDDELYQFYVAAAARGTGIASMLIADAEAVLARSGVAVAWLACAIGNNRAARFYEKCGWQRAGTMLNQLDTSNGVFELEVWRYEKPLARSTTTPP